MPNDQDTDAYAVVCFRLDGRWEVDVLPEVLTGDLRGLVSAVAQQPGELGAFALVDVADEFFVVVRVQEGRPHVLLSDVTAAAEWDLAAQVLDHLGLTVPGDDELEEIWPAGGSRRRRTPRCPVHRPRRTSCGLGGTTLADLAGSMPAGQG